jgi:peptide/nickel transport system substrate-binding protein
MRATAAWIAAAIVVLLGCGDGGGTAALPDESVVVVGTIADVQSWNPFLSESQFTDWVLGVVYPKLATEQTDYRDHPPSFEPALARDWSWSDDGLELEISLRSDASWSDGVPITADDVVYSLEIARSEDIGWYAADVAAGLVGIEASDPHTVRVRFDRRDPYAFMRINDTPIVPAHAWAEVPVSTWYDVDWSDRVIAGGPFRPVRHEPRQEIILEPNPGYWRPDHPRLDRVVFRIVPSKTALLTQLMAGGIDFMYGIPPTDARLVAEDPDLDLVSFPDRSYTHLVWNLGYGPLQDLRVRRALAMAVDRQALIAAVYRGDAELSSGPVLSTMWAFNNALEPPPYDPAAARSLLEQAGWVDSDGDGVRERDDAELRLELLAPSESEDRQDIARLLATDLERVGVRAEPRFQEWGTIIARLESRDFEAVVNRWVEPTRVELREIWHSAPPGAPTFNYGGYSNAEVDRLIDLMERLPDLEAQREPIDRIQELIVADQPYLFLIEARRLAALATRIRDADVNDASPFFNLDEWWVSTPP